MPPHQQLEGSTATSAEAVSDDDPHHAQLPSTSSCASRSAPTLADTDSYPIKSSPGPVAASAPTPTELQRACDRLLAGVVRGAAIGLTLRGGLHIVGSLLAAISKRRKRAVTWPHAIDDTLRYTAFLASLAGVYIGVDEGIAALFGKQKSARWRGLVAGMCAGPTLLLTGPRNRHYSLATYILLRGITLLVRVGNKERNKQRHPNLHALLAPTRIEHGDTLLMCAACSQIIYAFIMMPHTLPASYVRWIRKQGAKELFVWQGVRELAERTGSGRSLGPLTSLMGTQHAQHVASIPCHFFHPGQTCSQHCLQLLLPAYSRALSVYIPVYLLPAVLVHRKQLLKQPLPILQKVLQGIARSSLFLSAFISMAFGGACLGHNITGRSTGAILAASTWIGGLATLLEKKSRRLELALYVLSRSVESFSRCCVDWGWWSARWCPPRLDVLLFAAGAGAILHCYGDSNGVHRDVFRSKYLGVFDFVFGNTGFRDGRVKHVPSNQDLLRNMVMATAVGVRVRCRSVSHNSLSTLGSLRVRSASHGNLQSVMESPAASATAAAAAAAAEAVAAAAASVSKASAAAAAGRLGDSKRVVETEVTADVTASVVPSYTTQTSDSSSGSGVGGGQSAVVPTTLADADASIASSNATAVTAVTAEATAVAATPVSCSSEIPSEQQLDADVGAAGEKGSRGAAGPKGKKIATS